MAKKRRVYNSILGIPIWFIVGISIFLIISILYDLWVGDRNQIRYAILIGASLILIISVSIHIISIKSISKIASRQFGA